jgi:hypothetical protein
MPRPNIKEETRKFQEKLENGHFKVDRSGNSEVDYDEKIDRDTEAIKKICSSRLFKRIIDIVYMSNMNVPSDYRYLYEKGYFKKGTIIKRFET